MTSNDFVRFTAGVLLALIIIGIIGLIVTVAVGWILGIGLMHDLLMYLLIGVVVNSVLLVLILYNIEDYSEE